MIKAMSERMDGARRLRDTGCEHLFTALYSDANPLAQLIGGAPDSASSKDGGVKCARQCSTIKPNSEPAAPTSASELSSRHSME